MHIFCVGASTDFMLYAFPRTLLHWLKGSRSSIYGPFLHHRKFESKDWIRVWQSAAKNGDRLFHCINPTILCSSISTKILDYMVYYMASVYPLSTGHFWSKILIFFFWKIMLQKQSQSWHLWNYSPFGMIIVGVWPMYFAFLFVGHCMLPYNGIIRK